MFINRTKCTKNELFINSTKCSKSKQFKIKTDGLKCEHLEIATGDQPLLSSYCLKLAQRGRGS